MSSAKRARLDRTLAALADPHRRRVVDLLREQPLRAGELADAVGLAPPALSRHLKTLRESGLVEETHPAFDARVRIYSLKAAPMTELRAWLQETEELWAGQLASFKAHIEKAGK
jgi:DNA-binding transcriptional ArsR family regulator